MDNDIILQTEKFLFQGQNAESSGNAIAALVNYSLAANSIYLIINFKREKELEKLASFKQGLWCPTMMNEKNEINKNCSASDVLSKVLAKVRDYQEIIRQNYNLNVGLENSEKDKTSFENIKDQAKKDNISCQDIRSLIEKGNCTEFFSTVVGLDRAKNEIFNGLVNPLLYPNLFPTLSKGILIYGSPGTGKTLLARAAINELQLKDASINVIFFAPQGAQLKGRYVGETEQKIEALYSCASKIACECEIAVNETTKSKSKFISVIFLDEVESIAGDRSTDSSGIMTTSVNALLQAIDGVKSVKNVVTIAATNYPWKLDSAILRRFDTSILIDLPSAQDIRTLLDQEISNYLSTFVSNKSTCDIEKNKGFSNPLCPSKIGKEEEFIQFVEQEKKSEKDNQFCSVKCSQEALNQANRKDKKIWKKFPFNQYVKNLSETQMDEVSAIAASKNFSNSDIVRLFKNVAQQLGEQAIKNGIFFPIIYKGQLILISSACIAPFQLISKDLVTFILNPPEISDIFLPRDTVKNQRFTNRKAQSFNIPLLEYGIKDIFVLETNEEVEKLRVLQLLIEMEISIVQKLPINYDPQIQEALKIWIENYFNNISFDEFINSLSFINSDIKIEMKSDILTNGINDLKRILEGNNIVEKNKINSSNFLRILFENIIIEGTIRKEKIFFISTIDLTNVERTGIIKNIMNSAFNFFSRSKENIYNRDQDSNEYLKQLEKNSQGQLSTLIDNTSEWFTTWSPIETLNQKISGVKNKENISTNNIKQVFKTFQFISTNTLTNEGSTTLNLLNEKFKKEIVELRSEIAKYTKEPSFYFLSRRIESFQEEFQTDEDIDTYIQEYLKDRENNRLNDIIEKLPISDIQKKKLNEKLNILYNNGIQIQKLITTGPNINNKKLSNYLTSLLTTGPLITDKPIFSDDINVFSLLQSNIKSTFSFLSTYKGFEEKKKGEKAQIMTLNIYSQKDFEVVQFRQLRSFLEDQKGLNCTIDGKFSVIEILDRLIKNLSIGNPSSEIQINIEADRNIIRYLLKNWNITSQQFNDAFRNINSTADKTNVGLLQEYSRDPDSVIRKLRNPAK